MPRRERLPRSDRNNTSVSSSTIERQITMKIWHRANLDPSAEALLQRLEVKYKRGYSTLDPNRLTYLLTDIDEANPGWAELRPFVEPKQTFVWTEFSRDEIIQARWLSARSDHPIGYPYQDETRWDARFVKRGCSTCGVGWRQIAPFQVAKEPRLGRYDFGSFHGAFELFAMPKVLNLFSTLRITGYEVWLLLVGREKDPSTRLSQVLTSLVAEPAMTDKSWEGEPIERQICPDCGAVWYDYVRRGPMILKQSSLRDDVDFQLTHEWFGNGRTARREILVSERVAQLVVERKLHGLSLWPVMTV